jgi:hypothetical protein
VPARSEVLDGDRRLLYLAWLLSADSGMLDDDELEPPVPAGLGQMSGLQGVAEFLKIDPHLLTAAAESSSDLLSSTAQDNTALKRGSPTYRRKRRTASWSALPKTRS